MSVDERDFVNLMVGSKSKSRLAGAGSAVIGERRSAQRIKKVVCTTYVNVLGCEMFAEVNGALRGWFYIPTSDGFRLGCGKVLFVISPHRWRERDQRGNLRPGVSVFDACC